LFCCRLLPHTLEVAIKDYYDWADKHFLAIERRNRMSARLYHYTDMRGFEGIVKSETIWFTDYQYLNDPNEIDTRHRPRKRDARPSH
jgi:hypothetical protein